jgi:hypothetical protein
MGYVYILRSGETDCFKIGRTESDVEARIKQLSTGNPLLALFDVIETEHASKAEKFIHNRLQASRYRGRAAKEFFVITPDLMGDEIQLARDYAENDLPRLAEVAKLAAGDCEDAWIAPTERATRIVDELLVVRAQLAVLANSKERLEADLKLLIGTAVGVEGLASWNVVEGHRLDAVALARDEPILYARYYVPTRQRSFRLL